jgi:hypothetical protein
VFIELHKQNARPLQAGRFLSLKSGLTGWRRCWRYSQGYAGVGAAAEFDALTGAQELPVWRRPLLVLVRALGAAGFSPLASSRRQFCCWHCRFGGCIGAGLAATGLAAGLAAAVLLQAWRWFGSQQWLGRF